jgi:ABC-type sulfate/molybdate transport systems ATPase subunit
VTAGLEFPDRGTVRFEGRDVTAVSARKRRVDFVFQHHALFNHLSVFENVAFGVRVRGYPGAGRCSATPNRSAAALDNRFFRPR